jgi:CBS domain-containing protein
MFPVKSIMEKNASIVHADTHIYVAMNLMVKESVSGMAVLDEEQKLIGFISEKDVLGLLISGEPAERRTVADYMVRDVKTFLPDDSAVDVCEFFLQNAVHVLPVVDQTNTYQGVVRRRDLIFLILRIRGKIYRKEMH